MDLNVGFLGYGEVGSGVGWLFEDANSSTPPPKKPYVLRISDPAVGKSDDLSDCQIIHVSVPYRDNDQFLSLLKNTIPLDKTKFPDLKLIIIHSTTPPGATTFVEEVYKEIDVFVVHSPIRGVHPKIGPSLRVYEKFIGCNNGEAGKLAMEHMSAVGVPCTVMQPAESSELAKVLSTTYYGVCIAFHKEMAEICGRHGVDMKCIAEWNKTYNEGIVQIGNPHMQRPVMWVDEKPIGGHCVIPNVHILRMLEKEDGMTEEDRSLALQLILKYAPKGGLNGHLDSSL